MEVGVRTRRARVLVAIDFSEGSLGALREARWLADRAELEVRVLHVAEDGTPWTPDVPQLEWLRIAPVEPGMILVRQGRPWVEIVRYAGEISAAFLVLGSHGASGGQTMTLGSTASRVTLRSPCPVLLVSHLTSSEQPSPSLHTSKEQV
jgi:nucleotide-binding universal stress UspA family protein